MRLIFLVAANLAIAAGSSMLDGAPVTIAALSGQFTGTYHPATSPTGIADIVEFRGIKYGLSNRFEAPYASPYMIANATEFGSSYKNFS